MDLAKKLKPKDNKFYQGSSHRENQKTYFLSKRRKIHSTSLFMKINNVNKKNLQLENANSSNIKNIEKKKILLRLPNILHFNTSNISAENKNSKSINFELTKKVAFMRDKLKFIFKEKDLNSKKLQNKIFEKRQKLDKLKKHLKSKSEFSERFKKKYYNIISNLEHHEINTVMKKLKTNTINTVSKKKKSNQIAKENENFDFYFNFLNLNRNKHYYKEIIWDVYRSSINKNK